MAFSFGNTGGGNASLLGGSSAGGAQVNQGDDLELIQTEGLGFLNIGGEAKLQLVSKWSEPPLPTASLISIASHKGLVAAAGPDAVILATTDSIRKALTAEGGSDSDSGIRPFSPQISIPMQLRVSQLAFTADETSLVLSAETGGGLAVYDVQAVAQGSTTQSAFELSTNGETLRSLAANPMADKAELCALVTANGNLLMADLKQRSLRNGPSGQAVLRTQVSCAAWSSKGKQLVAGCADGSVYQMTPDGQEKAHIPKPPKLGDYYVAAIAWLENDVFLLVHNPTAPGEPSQYHIVTRHAKAGAAPEFVYQKLNDPVEPFGDKVPHHSILRLRDFPPDLQDVLMVASTAVENIGLLTRSKTPLASDVAADKISHVFTTTELADDSRRAQLPMSADYNDTFPIGVSLDLSSKDKVYKPIPADEMDESPGPLPGLWVLNNEGVLVAWWVVYNESIRQGTTFPGLAAVDGGIAAKPAVAATAATAATGFSSPKAAAPAFGAATALQASPAPAFGSASALQSSPAPAFGSTPALGSNTSPWGKAASTAAAASGSPSRAPAFGAPSALGSGSAFGAPSGMGSHQSVWGSASKTPAAPAFGQSSFGSSSSATPAASSGNAFSAFAKTASPFAAATTSSSTAATSNPFASFKSTGQSGFASLASNSNTTSGSIFSSTSTAKPFGTSTAFGAPSSTSSFGAPSGTSSFGGATSNTSTAFPPANKTAGSSAFGSSPFVLGTTFKADPATANDNETKPAKSSSSGGGGGGSLFGSGFGLSLTQPANAADQDMETTASPAAEEQPLKPSPSIIESTTPTTTPAPASRFFSPLTTTASASPTLFGATASTGLFSSRPGGLFGSVSDKTKTETVANVSEPAPAKKEVEEESKQERLPPAPLPPSPVQQALPLPPDTIKEDAPLPPDPFAAAAKAAKKPVKAEPAEPPLPPDPFAKPKKPAAEAAAKTAIPEDAPLPPDPFATKPKSVQPKTEGKTATATALPPLSSLPSLSNPFAAAKSSAASASKSIFSSMPAPSNDPALRNPFANLPKPPLSPSTVESEEDDLSEEGEIEGEEGEEREEEAERGEEEEEEEEEEDVDDEGSGTDVAKDLSPSTTTGFVHTPSFSTRGSFTTAGLEGSVNSTFSHIEMPKSQLFGDRDAPNLRPSRNQETSPRSPSPQRPAAKVQGRLHVGAHAGAHAGAPGRLFRDESQRSFSAPGMASQLLRDPSRAMPVAAHASRGFESSGMFASRQRTRDANMEEQRKADAMRAMQESQRLPKEDSYDIMDRELDRPPEPTRQLAECVYILDSDIEGGDSVATQAEAVYRDINRMVLVLKVNSRNLEAFLRGHAHAEGVAEHKTADDLDDPEDWVLCDVDDLGRIVSRDLSETLRQSRVKGEEAMQAAAESLLKEGSRLQVMHDDVVRMVQTQAHPDQVAAARLMPLSAEQATQQHDLRRTLTRVMEQLVEAEQQLVLLRTKLSSLAAAAAAAGHGGSSGGGRSGLPTVDAVMRTIAKMTAMAEKRSGDIDVLEVQMRKLGLGREGSPFTTPQKQRQQNSHSHSHSHSSSVAGHQKRGSVLFSPGSAQRSAFFSSPGVGGTPTRRKLGGYTDKEKAQLREMRASRQRTLARLQKVQQAEGPRYTPMD